MCNFYEVGLQLFVHEEVNDNWIVHVALNGLELTVRLWTVKYVL